MKPRVSKLHESLALIFDGARIKPRRSMREFAESDVIIPTGQYRGLPFRCSRQPYSRCLFDALDSGLWSEHVITGPSQSGKTLSAHVIPVLHRIAEVRRNIVNALPDIRMANDKWFSDFLPVILASPGLIDLLPKSGPGSKGGQVKNSIAFSNNAIMKYMTTGGSDQARAGFTADGGVFVTELAGFSASGESSVEANPLKQIEARMRSLTRRDRYLVAEGTVSLEDQLPWSLRANSTRSRLVSPCPHCEAWISPEREDLAGWDSAESEIEAGDKASFFCPACGESINESERLKSLQDLVLLHDGQTIRRGKVVGKLPETLRLWFRWSAWHNALLSVGDVAIDEWRKSRMDPESQEAENAERELCQFVWCTPYTPPKIVIDELAKGDVARRASDLPRGEMPDDTIWLGVGADCGMYALHWCVIAQRTAGGFHVVDYGTIDVLRRGTGTATTRGKDAGRALLEALAELKKRCEIGWSRRQPDHVLIDANYLADEVHAFARRAGTIFTPSLGRGMGQGSQEHYAHPVKKTLDIRVIGERFHVRRHPKHRTLYAMMDVNHWKSRIHRALRVDADQAGALTMFLDQQYHHETFDRHLRAEQQRQEFHARRGQVEVWTNDEKKPNHYFDATVGAMVGLAWCRESASASLPGETVGGVAYSFPR